MALFFASLNSGSNGNCYYVGNEKDAVLIDAGISCREIEKRLRVLNLPVHNIRAIFISHEHSDHIKGVSVFSKKFKIPVYITPLTQQYERIYIPEELIFRFSSNEEIQVGELVVVPFSKFHDARDPYSFSVCCGELRVGVFTDIGRTCENLISHFNQCQAAFLESNYDEEMLESGPYPFHLKHRIRGGSGHLSNLQALRLFQTHRSSSMSHLILSHLSKNNNHPKLVADLFAPFCENVQVIVASREEPSPLFFIGNKEEDLSTALLMQGDLFASR